MTFHLTGILKDINKDNVFNNNIFQRRLYKTKAVLALKMANSWTWKPFESTNNETDLDIELLKSEVGKHFPFYDMRYNVKTAAFFCRIDKELLEEKLKLLSERDQPPHYIIVGLPDDLLRRCKVAKYFEKGLGGVHRDLRRAFKSVAMKYHIPTQLLRQPTMEGKDKDNPSKIAWNFFTGLYFKAGGIPWGPTGLSPGTCYVGVSFYRPLGSTFSLGSNARCPTKRAHRLTTQCDAAVLD